MFRQGDLLFVPITSIPSELREVPREDGRLILARGEATGHAHAVAESAVLLLEPPDQPGVAFLDVEEICQVVHEEHAPITLQPGKYRVVHQREYMPSLPKGMRLVLD